jgi:hypothetical protein
VVAPGEVRNNKNLHKP